MAGRRCLLQAAYDPRFLEIYMKLEKFYDLRVQDAASFAGEGEELSFMQLQVGDGWRVESLG